MSNFSPQATVHHRAEPASTTSRSTARTTSKPSELPRSRVRQALRHVRSESGRTAAGAGRGTRGASPGEHRSNSSVPVTNARTVHPRRSNRGVRHRARGCAGTLQVGGFSGVAGICSCVNWGWSTGRLLGGAVHGVTSVGSRKVVSSVASWSGASSAIVVSAVDGCAAQVGAPGRPDR